MALNRGTRHKGFALASAMAATFPCVFLFQAAAAPLIVAMVFGAVWLSSILDPASTVTHVTTSGLEIAALSGTLLLAFVAMLAVSVVGFIEGWLLGWRCAYGGRFRDMIKRGPTARLFRKFGFAKRHPVS
jgi:ABC-type sulfate transport system permease component